jgi:hypothetical protein
MIQDWLRKPLRNMHFTIRESDIIDFDVKRFIDDMVDLNANIVTLLTAGYHAIYPSEIPLNRRNPFLGERDLLKEIVEEAHKKELRVGSTIDVITAPKEIWENHPDWIALRADGKPYFITNQYGELYAACLNGPYVKEFILSVIKEQLESYDLDIIFLTAFNFHGFCYCPRCRHDFKQESGYDIPLNINWKDPVWKKFIKWRIKTTNEIWKYMYEGIKKIKPDIAIMGNNVLDWAGMRNSGLDMDYVRDYEDIIKTEAQTRVVLVSLDKPVKEQPMFWPAEEGRYMKTITSRPPLISSNYCYVWPWRRSAVPPIMQKLWLAEVIANGSNIFLHMGGPPAKQEDRRGLGVIREMFGLVKENEEYYIDVESYTNVALVLSQNTLNFYCEDTERQYVEYLRGMYSALNDAHITFDIISEKFLSPEKLAKYKVLILPNCACMSEETAEVLRKFVREGGNIVATYETSLYTEDGESRGNFLLSDLFGVDYLGIKIGPMAGVIPPNQRINGYMAVNKPDHPLFKGLGDTEYILDAGFVCLTEPHPNTEVPLTVVQPFEIFPEGRAYNFSKRTQIPAAVVNYIGSGSVVYFPGEMDRLFWHLKFPDHRLLLVNAVTLKVQDKLLAYLKAPMTVDFSVQIQQEKKRVIVHLINLTGKRPYAEIIPVRNLEVTIRIPEGFSFKRAISLTQKQAVPFGVEDKTVKITLGELRDYEVIILEQ